VKRTDVAQFSILLRFRVGIFQIFSIKGQASSRNKSMKLILPNFFFALFTSLAGTAYAEIPQIERDALIALYNSTDGANWTENTSWLGAVGTECDWYGVTCSSGSVSRIGLYRNSLSGSIPAAIGDLTQLEEINFYKNSLTGEIPKEISNLSKLKLIQMGDNKLSGSLPSGISALENLEQIYLSNNELTGDIPVGLGELTKIYHLNLSNNSFSGSIPAELGNLANLGYLNLGGNSFSGIIPPELGNLSKLLSLYLYTNSLSGSIPAGLSKLTNLTDLRLSNNSLSGSIPSELGNLTNLTYLSLGVNDLSGSIPSELGDLTNLTGLLLYNNSLSGSIPSELGNMTNLTGLYLYNNSLSGSIPSELGNLTNLTDLYLHNNSISGSIPSELGNLTNLTRLYLNNNSLSGSIPSELGNLTNLSRIYLYANSLSGSIPSELGNLTNLTYLTLSSNSLTGSIPAELGNLTNLTSLNLSYNFLSGSIPSELGNLAKLTNLNLNSNKLSRPKPVWLSSFAINDNAFDPDSDKDGIDDGIDTNIYSVAMIKEIIGSDYSLSILGSGRVVNLVSKSLFNETSGALSYAATTQITKILYSNLEDEFDFIMIAANNKKCCSDAGFYGRFRGVQNKTKGLGKSIYDSTDSYGSSGRLQGVIHFPYLYGLTGGPGLHEIAHNWGNDLIKTEVGGHWGYSNVGGQLGGWQPNSLVTLADGVYQTKGPLDAEPSSWGSFANGGNSVPYSNLELYIMGMIGADEVGHDIKIAEDFEWTDDFSQGIFSASSITNLTMDQIIADKGIREPNHLDSQKNFRAMYVVVSEVPLTREEWRVTDKFVYDFQLEGDDGDSSYNFWEATQGKGTMSFDQIDNFLTTTAITFDPSNDAPVVNIGGANSVIEDLDGVEGEFVNLSATASDADGSVIKTEWLINELVVATGLTPTIRLANGDNTVTFRATDNDGAASIVSVDIKIKAHYISSAAWPAPFNGVIPNSTLSLTLNNIGVYEASTGLISSCVKIYTNNEISDIEGIAKFDILFNLLNDISGAIRYAGSRPFNTIEKLTLDKKVPDCSGKYETTTNIYSDTIETRLATDLFGVSLPIIKTFNVSFQLIDAANLTFRLLSYEELVAPLQTSSGQLDRN
jgi:Leucine-rich repeat (LRR) protein